MIIKFLIEVKSVCIVFFFSRCKCIFSSFFYTNYAFAPRYACVFIRNRIYSLRTFAFSRPLFAPSLDGSQKQMYWSDAFLFFSFCWPYIRTYRQSFTE